MSDLALARRECLAGVHRGIGGLRTVEAIGAIADFDCSRALASGSRGGTGHCRWAEEFSKALEVDGGAWHEVYNIVMC